jgi:membrane-associated phospholipid phosphatase
MKQQVCCRSRGSRGKVLVNALPFNFSLLRRSEWICLGYFAYVTVLAFLIRIPARRRWRLVVLNVAVGAGLLVLPEALESAPGLFASVLRDWLPAPLIFLGYHEAGVLTFPRSDQFFEKAFLRWDDTLFRWPLLRFLGSTGRLPGWLDAALEFAYLQCYVIVPSGIAVLYFAHLGRFADQYWSIVLPAVFIAYGLTPVFPAEPPRQVRRDCSPARDSSRLRRLNLWLLDHGSIKVNTFPSGHAAGAVSASLALLGLLPAAGVCYAIIAVGILLGAVRGRYHYALDVALGAAVAVAAYLGSLLI